MNCWTAEKIAVFCCVISSDAQRSAVQVLKVLYLNLSCVIIDFVQFTFGKWRKNGSYFLMDVNIHRMDHQTHAVWNINQNSICCIPFLFLHGARMPIACHNSTRRSIIYHYLFLKPLKKQLKFFHILFLMRVNSKALLPWERRILHLWFYPENNLSQLNSR